MPRWQKPKPLNYSGLPVSVSSFNIIPIRDPLFSPETNVFVIYNHADRKKKSTPSLLGNDPVSEDRKTGKPAGYGMPGGGVNSEYLEKSDGAAIREGTNESGVRIIRVREIPIQGDKNKVLIEDKRTGKLRWIPYSDGQQKSVELKPWERATLNPMNYYLATVEWESSKTREFLVELRENLLAQGLRTKEDIADFGLAVNDLTQEELLALGIDREEVAEIGGFALLPFSFLKDMWQHKDFFINPDEDKDAYYRNGKVGPTTYVYRSHVERILQGLEIMGITS